MRNPDCVNVSQMCPPPPSGLHLSHDSAFGKAFHVKGSPPWGRLKGGGGGDSAAPVVVILLAPFRARNSPEICSSTVATMLSSITESLLALVFPASQVSILVLDLLSCSDSSYISMRYCKLLGCQWSDIGHFLAPESFEILLPLGFSLGKVGEGASLNACDGSTLP